MGVDSFTGTLGRLGTSALTWAIIVIVGVIVLAVLGGVAFWAYKRKKWNLRIEIKIPRNDGTIIASEKAKGHYDIVSGIVDIKRKRLKIVGMKPFDVRKYLQGDNFLEVIQISPNEYLPVLPKSYLELKEEDIKDKEGKVVKGEKYTILDIETNLQKRKVWKTYMERAAKDRFTLWGWLEKHWKALELGLIMFVIFLGFSILWMRLPSICN